MKCGRDAAVRVKTNDFNCERDASYIQLRCSDRRKQYRGMCRAPRDVTSLRDIDSRSGVVATDFSGRLCGRVQLRGRNRPAVLPSLGARGSSASRGSFVRSP